MFPAAEFGMLLAHLEQDLQTEDGLWTLRGFVDIARRVYSLGSDTKVISNELSVPPFRNLREYLHYRNRLDLVACLEEVDETVNA